MNLGSKVSKETVSQLSQRFDTNAMANKIASYDEESRVVTEETPSDCPNFTNKIPVSYRPFSPSKKKATLKAKTGSI